MVIYITSSKDINEIDRCIPNQINGLQQSKTYTIHEHWKEADRQSRIKGKNIYRIVYNKDGFLEYWQEKIY